MYGPQMNQSERAYYRCYIINTYIYFILTNNEGRRASCGSIFSLFGYYKAHATYEKKSVGELATDADTKAPEVLKGACVVLETLRLIYTLRFVGPDFLVSWFARRKIGPDTKKSVTTQQIFSCRARHRRN